MTEAEAPSANFTHLRLFTGYSVSRNVKAAAQRWQQGSQGVRWTPPRNLHITLTFIGDTPVEIARQLHEKLKTVNVAAFNLLIEKIGVFDSARALWLGSEESPELRRAKRDTDLVLDSLNIPYDKKPFVPHITLARSRGKLEEPLLKELTRLIAPSLPLTVTLEKPVLFASIQTDNGTEYVPLDKLEL